MTFDTLTQRFEELVTLRDLAGMLPYSVMSAEDLTWLSEAAPTLTITDQKGYEFANGDLAVLFFCEPVPVDYGDEAERSLSSLAGAVYSRSDDEVWAFLTGSSGYLIVSENYRSKLGTLAQMAAVGIPVEHYLEQLERPFDAVTERFEAWVTHEDLPGSLPFVVMPAEETAWISQAAPEAMQAAGYKFANGDLALLFGLAPFPSYEAFQAAQEAIEAAARTRYAGQDEVVWVRCDEDFGYVIVTSSDDYRQTLMLAADWARWSGPPDW
jgi:hypothetical protein